MTAGEDTEGVVGGTTPVTFDYTISNGDTTDTATVEVDVQYTCGVVEVKLQDQNGNSIQADSISVEYAGETITEYNTDTLHQVVDLFDDGREASVSKTNIDLPSGYQIPENNWIGKQPNGDDGHPNDPTRSQLGF